MREGGEKPLHRALSVAKIDPIGFTRQPFRIYSEGRSQAKHPASPFCTHLRLPSKSTESDILQITRHLSPNLSDRYRMTSPFISLHFVSFRMVFHTYRYVFDSLQMARHLKLFSFVLHRIAYNLELINFVLHCIACNLKRINFVLHRIACNLERINFASDRMAYNLKQIHFVSDRIACNLMRIHFVSDRISCDLTRIHFVNNPKGWHTA